MEEKTKIGEFNLYDRVKIKNKNVTGNIVLIYDEKECEVEYDSQYDTEGKVVYTHKLKDLEHE